MHAANLAAAPPATPLACLRNPVGTLRSRWATMRADDRRGAVAVEMAVVMTFIFVPMLLGIIEFGRAMMVGQIVTTASRYGVRHAILEGSTNREVIEMVEDYLISSLNVSRSEVTVDITIDPDGANPVPSDIDDAQRRDLVTVEVGIPWNAVALAPGKYLQGKTISSAAAMRHE